MPRPTALVWFKRDLRVRDHAPLAEAMQFEQAAGLVHTRQGVGTFVLGPEADAAFRLGPQPLDTLRDVVAVLELRIGLETEAAGLAAQRRTEAQLGELRSALDALEALFDRRADTFCLVTSDSDFAGLCRKLRERGATVHVIGEAKTPEALRNASDQFFEWQAPDTATSAGEPKPEAAKPVKRRPRSLIAAVTLLAANTSHYDGVITALEARGLRVVPAFATGLDARGRRQYRYHPQWRAQRDEGKFEHMQAFGRVLPRLRSRVARDLAAHRNGQPLTRTLVLATLVRLLDTTYLRVGNEEYAATNRSYGLTTLRTRHVQLKGSQLKLRFRGKSGVLQEVELDDPRVARVVRRCQQLPGQELFQYEDEDGSLRTVGSGDVNDYLL